MAEIVSNLFGIDPAALQQQRALTDQEAALKYASLDDLSRARYGIALGARGIGRGITQLMGGDEEMNRATQVRQIASQFQMTTPEGLEQFAQAVSPFAPEVAQVAVQRANQLRTSVSQLQTGELTRQKTQMDITSSERKIAQDKKLREALAALPPNATNEQYLAVFRQFGSPDQQSRFIQASMDNTAKIAAAKAGKADKELPAGTVKEIATAEKINNTLNRTNTTLDNYITEVNANKIEFNLGKNIAGWVQRGVGKQDANTLKQVSLSKFLENERNAILLAAKGTQTEGDADRAMKQIFGRTDWTSNVAVSQALSDLKEYKNSQIDSNNVFISSLRSSGLPVVSAAAPRTPPTTTQGQEFAVDYVKYKAKYGPNALPYADYVAKRKGL